ncbi:MAG TPA: DUF5058 family protein [Candidatus Limiplasma sp.]|nr:DUF5058 family protein [Candidatus Limiplasma sp.]HPR78856.1 DUF5058 family protein [Candidatus Limiplasma sp.]
MPRPFSVNDPFLYIVVAVILLLVLAQSIFFLVRSWRRALALGMQKSTLRRVVRTSATFTVVPAISILIGVIALSRKLGLPLPWLRLSVIGAITYETPAAEAAARAVGTTLGDTATMLTAPQYTTIAWVMTLGIMAGVLFTPILCKRLLSGVDRLEKRDRRWSEIFMNALFMGMISAFLGMIFGHVTEGLTGWIPVFVMLASAVIMLMVGACVKLLKWNWLTDYALSISMVGAMALAIPITSWVTGVVA